MVVILKLISFLSNIFVFNEEVGLESGRYKWGNKG